MRLLFLSLSVFLKRPKMKLLPTDIAGNYNIKLHLTQLLIQCPSENISRNSLAVYYKILSL